MTPVARRVLSHAVLRKAAFFISTFSVWVGWIAWLTGFGSEDFGSWVQGWHRWDAEWYRRIWFDGYSADPTTLAFPPGYSWLIGFISEWTSLSFGLTAMIVNLAAFFAAGCVATRFVSRHFGLPWWAVWVFHMANPVAYFAFSSYSDAFFMLLFWLALGLAVKPVCELARWQKTAAGALLFFAPWFRLTGFSLLIWILFKRWYATLVLIPLGLLLWANWLATGNALYFLSAQRSFVMPEGWLWHGLIYHAQELFRPPPPWKVEESFFWLAGTVLPWVSLLLLGVSSTWLFRRRERLLAVTILAVALFSRNQAFWRSVLRYDLPLFPLMALPWIVWASARGNCSARRLVGAVVFLALIVAGFVLQSLFAGRMHGGAWTF